jgi:hypothetical protein
LSTGRDAAGRVLAKALDPTSTTLGSIMTVQPPNALRNIATATDALRRMQDGGFRHMPILDGTKIVGIASRGDFTDMERARLDEQASGKSCRRDRNHTAAACRPAAGSRYASNTLALQIARGPLVGDGLARILGIGLAAPDPSRMKLPPRGY